ncbi:hypothetical protein [Nesterenkonia sp. F]|uniref:hypothetical protein n=1 Tax=Nesterenkonia sp. F TaxID=795955 RepID=UPI000255CFE6|nr:hypothetical protein [Nesterenkonia sp. F]
MLNTPIAALLAEASEEHGGELFMPAPWFGIIMFALLMSMLLITVSFSSKGRQLPAKEHEDH